MKRRYMSANYDLCLSVAGAVIHLALLTDGFSCFFLNDCSYYHWNIGSTMTNVACRKAFV